MNAALLFRQTSILQLDTVDIQPDDTITPLKIHKAVIHRSI